MINLYGASGHCKVIIDIITNIGLTINKIYDDNKDVNEILNFKVTKSENLSKSENEFFIISIGNNKIRKNISKKFDLKYIKAVHKSAIVSSSSTINHGTVVMPGSIINSNVKIGEHCIINTASVIEHDCQISDYVHICPNVSLAGGVNVGEGSQVGIGATVIQGIKIGKWSIIDAGSVIIRDVPDYSIVVGNPGKVIKFMNKDNEN